MDDLSDWTKVKGPVRIEKTTATTIRGFDLINVLSRNAASADGGHGL